MTSVVPLSQLTLKWDAPVDFGCLPITAYVLSKDGVDLADVITPEMNSFVDTHLTTGGTIGTQITYKMKTVNYAGSSSYSDPITVTVGVVPNAPTGFAITSHPEESVVKLSWSNGAAIASNPATLAFKIYLDDLSGNAPSVVFDTTGKALVY